MQDLIIELNQLRDTLSKAIKILKQRGIEKAEAERNYRVELAKEILRQRDAGTPVTIISDICRGKEEIADLKRKRDIAESLYETALQKVYQTKLELDIIKNQIKAEQKGEIL